MLYVVNYKGRQVHSTSVFHRAAGGYVIFEDGTYADTSNGTTGGPGAARFVRREDDGYLPPGGQVGEGIIVVDVASDGSFIARSAHDSTAVTGSGTTVNLGDPDGGNRGIVVGGNNIQVNHFR